MSYCTVVDRNAYTFNHNPSIECTGNVEQMPDNRTIENNNMPILDAVIPFLWRLGTVVAGLVAVAVGFLYVKQDSLLYFPGEFM